MSLGAGLMAPRPKQGAKKPDVRSSDERLGVIHIKGTVEYSKWLDKLHQATHIPKAVLFRIAIAEWALRNGHPAPPEF